MVRSHCDLTENLLGALVLDIGDRMSTSLGAAAGLGANGPASLVLLAQETSLTIGQLAALLGISHPAAVQLVDRLAALGLVDRRPGEDARVRRVTLTAAGRKVVAKVLAQRATVLSDALAVLNATERKTLRGLLNRMIAGLDLDRRGADHFCRLCDVSVCTNDVCPAEGSARAAEAGASVAAKRRPARRAVRSAAR